MSEYHLAWVDATGCTTPLADCSRADIERHASVLEELRISRKGRAAKDIKLLYKTRSEPVDIIYALGICISKKKPIEYALGILRNMNEDGAAPEEEPQAAPEPEKPKLVPTTSNWVALNRSILRNDFLNACPCWVQLMWVHFILLASYASRIWDRHGKETILQRGQLFITQRDLAKRYKVSQRMVNYYLQKFSENQMIQYVAVIAKPDSVDWENVSLDVSGFVSGHVSGGSVVTLLNYNKFQPGFSDGVSLDVSPSVSLDVSIRNKEVNEKGTEGYKDERGGLALITPKEIFEIWNGTCDPIPQVTIYDTRSILASVEPLVPYLSKFPDPQGTWAGLVKRAAQTHPTFHVWMSPSFFAKDLDRINRLTRGGYDRSFGDTDAGKKSKTDYILDERAANKKHGAFTGFNKQL